MGCDEAGQVILGIDLGARSVGWAVMTCRESDGQWEPTGILDAGTRCFPAGVDGNLDEGKDEARAATRRMHRGARRQLYRRAQRVRRTLRALANASILPGAVASPSEARHAYLAGLDDRLKDAMLADGETVGPVNNSPIYQLRRRCLTGARSLEEIGRALLHLGQRRGFKSNRKSRTRDDEKGAVEQAIAGLEREMESAGSRTLGEHLSKLNPHECRIRNRWTARPMYEAEFEAMWAAQAPHHPQVMTDEAKARIHSAIFHQRPLKPSAHLIGLCELEPPRRRAPMGCLIYQRFRIVQKVNDLTWRDEHGVLCGPLSIDDPRRSALIERLDSGGDMTLMAAKQFLGLHKKAQFMLEEGASKTLAGNRTAARLIPAIGAHWERWTVGQRDAFVNELLSDIEQSKWERRLVEHWGLTDEQAAKVAGIELQSGYASLSRRAMRRLLPEMEAGAPYATARKRVYGTGIRMREPVNRLPGVLMPDSRKWLGRISNPAVARALTETRKVVNAVIRKYGKPVRIRIELARDLRNSRADRQRITKNIKERTVEREQHKAEMVAALPHFFEGREPRRADVEKWALAKECNWMCPYTEKSITPGALFGATAEFDVEHIIPRTRRPDDSFVNKTLCHADANREKNNRTPFEAYHGTARWHEIIERVKRFRGPAARAKLRLFELEEIDEDFTNRDLNDTRYASRLAKDYLGMLYGGSDGIDETGRRCVQACCGGITAILRNEWGLNSILGPDGQKNRRDHRHHAVDAIAIALASPRAVQVLATAAGNAAAEGRRRYAHIPEPWQGFRADVERCVGRILVSHRVDQTLSGGLHAATNYSPEKTRRNADGSRADEVRHVRKKLVGITEPQVRNIVDPRVRKAVVDFLGGRDPKAVFKEGGNGPTLPNRRDPAHPVPIRRVRVWERANAFSLGSSGSARHVLSETNSHIEIFTAVNRRGQVEWGGRIVTLLEAVRQVRAVGSPYLRDYGPDTEFVMSVRKGDYFELDVAGTRCVMRVEFISDGDIAMREPRDASGAAVKSAKQGRFSSYSAWRAANPRKVSVSPIGEVGPCHE